MELNDSQIAIMESRKQTARDHALPADRFKELSEEDVVRILSKNTTEQ